jgi:hypothetical protein
VWSVLFPSCLTAYGCFQGEQRRRSAFSKVALGGYGRSVFARGARVSQIGSLIGSLTPLRLQVGARQRGAGLLLRVVESEVYTAAV